MSQDAVAPAAACRNCGAGLVGEYCQSCGEPRPNPHEYQWKHLVHDAIHEFIHLDGKIFRTLWLLIARAGFLTQEYWAGRRTAYIRPLRLYIVVAAVHLLLISHNFYRVELFKHVDSSGGLGKYLDTIAVRTNRTPAEVEQSANSHLAKAYSVMQYTAVLAFALVPWVVYRRQKPYYVQHFIFSLHVYCFYFLLTGALALLITREQWVGSRFLPLITLAYLLIALRRLYGESWFTSVWKAVVIRIGLFATEFAVLGFALAYAILQVQLGH
jgi:hypothetical protein